MSLSILNGLTSQTVDLFIADTASTTGGGKTGLVYNTSGLSAWYRKGATGTLTQITLATQTVGGAWSSGGFVEIDATNSPGLYRLDLPNAAVDTSGFATITLKGTALVMAPVRVDCRPVPRVTLADTVTTYTGNTPQTGDSFARIGSAGAGLTAVGDTRLANLDAAVSTRATPTNITAGTLTTVTNLTNLPTAPTDWLTAAAVKADAVTKVQNGLATPTNITSATGVTLAAVTHTGAVIPTVTNLNNAPTSGDLTATMKASVTAAVPSVTQIRTEMDTNSSQLAAILAAVLATNNLSSLANIYGPGVMEIPTSGSRVFKFTLAIKDQEGKAVNLDSTPTITVTNESGTSRAANLSSVTAVATGKYTFTYTQTSSAVSEQLTFESAGTVSGEARPAYWVAVVADYDATSMLTAIDAALALVKAKTDNLPASPAAVGSAMTLTSDYDAAMTAATQASVNTLTEYVDTEVASIKGVTDQFAFTAGRVDAATDGALSQGDIDSIVTGVADGLTAPGLAASVAVQDGTYCTVADVESRLTAFGVDWLVDVVEVDGVRQSSETSLVSQAIDYCNTIIDTYIQGFVRDIASRPSGNAWLRDRCIDLACVRVYTLGGREAPAVLQVEADKAMDWLHRAQRRDIQIPALDYRSQVLAVTNRKTGTPTVVRF